MIDRRTFLKSIAAWLGTVAVPKKATGGYTLQKFLQKHYKEMTSVDKERVFKRI